MIKRAEQNLDHVTYVRSEELAGNSSEVFGITLETWRPRSSKQNFISTCPIWQLTRTFLKRIQIPDDIPNTLSVHPTTCQQIVQALCHHGFETSNIRHKDGSCVILSFQNTIGARDNVIRNGESLLSNQG